MSLNIDKKLKYILANNFYVGFEVECIIKKDYDVFEEKILKIHKDIDIGSDDSIEMDGGNCFSRDSDEECIEIRTPPLKTIESLEILHQVFELIKQYGYTNSSCGLHINISPISDELYYKVNPFYVIQHELFKNIKKAFKRQNNEFCVNCDLKGFSLKNPFNIYLTILRSIEEGFNEQEIGYSHYSAVNFSNYDSKRHKDSRLEIRVMGNRGYHKKFKSIVRYTNAILKVFMCSTKAK